MEELKMTPMMSQYLITKEEYSDCILFYRLGDFYEMFFEDAKIASRELEIALTGKSCGLEKRAPMCGVPHHSANSYIAKLVEKGYKVAICEQVEDPKTTKGIVKREVVRIVTPGTVIEEDMLDGTKNNYLCVIYKEKEVCGLAFSDVSTGEVFVTSVDNDDDVQSEFARYSPAEIVINSDAYKEYKKLFEQNLLSEPVVEEKEYFIKDADEILKKQFKNEVCLDSVQKGAVCGLIKYLLHTQKRHVTYIDSLEKYKVSQYMEIDPATRRNLEITESMRNKKKKGSLLWVLDETKTAMGARLLKQWLEKPLTNTIQINKRLYSVQELFENIILRDEIREALSKIYDIARIVSRISLKNVKTYELLNLRNSLFVLPELKKELMKTQSALLSEMGKNLDILEDVANLIDVSISEEVTEGEIIKGGYSRELDELRYIRNQGRGWMTRVEAEERQKTGIKNLKVAYNKVFGYYIEVTNSYKDLVPEHYIRKQTLVNGERYITPELKEMENMVLGANDKIKLIEEDLYSKVLDNINLEYARLKEACRIVSAADVIASFATVAYKNNYIMPEMSTGGEIVIKQGRHPVVEKSFKDVLFVPNDTSLNTEDSRLMMITGPNMAGKSTYMRQVALITLMSQVGSFVPTSYAKITPADRIFTRVGASDDIASGQSTFMLEMLEVAAIIKYATKNSLVILDEIGRGTSTFDGLSIAWAIAERIHDAKKCGAKTLFATHYHELTELENLLEGVKNYSVAVKKRGDEITFLRRIVRGGTDDSFGIEVAALAGIPKDVILRAKEILKDIEGNDTHFKKESSYPEPKAQESQMDFSDAFSREIVEELKNMDVGTYTLIEATNKLYELSARAKEL